MLQPIDIKTQKYRELAYAAIKEAILAGELGAGRSLVEEQLAAIFKISRTPVREALAILEHEGLIGSKGGRGLYVKIVSRLEFIEMFSANEAVEPILARRAAHLASEEELQDMAAILERGRRYIEKNDFIHFLSSDRQFHRMLGMAAQNTPLMNFILRNKECIDLYLINSSKIAEQGDMEASIREYEAIHGAVIRRDPEEAARLTIYHAQSVRERLDDLFREDETEMP